MQELLTGDDIFAHVLMMRAADQRTILLLEGFTDCITLDPHVDAASCHTMQSHGKRNALKAAQLAETRGVPRVIALVDADLDLLPDPSEQSLPSNVFTTDYYDLEAEIFFCGPVLTRVMSAFSSEEHAATREPWQEPPGGVAALVAGHVGILRYHAFRRGYEINLRNFPMHRVIDVALKVDVSVLCSIAVHRSSQPGISESELERELAEELETVGSVHRYCSGHDLVNALASVIRRLSNQPVSSDNVAQALRAGFSCDCISTCGFYGRIKDWATANNTTVWACAQRTHYDAAS